MSGELNMIDAFEKTPDPTLTQEQYDNLNTPSERLNSLVNKDMSDAISELVDKKVK